MSMDPARPRPNIILILADNLRWGELGCYGGTLRGAAAQRNAIFDKEGLFLHNFNVESDCVPTRSALMTGRQPIRTGCLQSIPASMPQGLTPWEATLAEVLRDEGYATARHGKWHLGDVPSRYPSDRGFDEWEDWGPSENVFVYDLKERRHIDVTLVEQSKDWIHRQAKAESRSSFIPILYTFISLLCHITGFQGKTGNGEFADFMAEIDYRVGQLPDHDDGWAIGDNTVAIFISDNGSVFPTKARLGP
ncbi:putative Sulfatase N-terminal domain-containing protein [Seiridium cardinale]|uniref:Sulfatase N-terminal domain-containing protein n=1 Tax=Seiridium cardinale TaxID=138064 RepID=A0ABR2XEI3_9PEZI